MISSLGGSTALVEEEPTAAVAMMVRVCVRVCVRGDCVMTDRHQI